MPKFVIYKLSDRIAQKKMGSLFLGQVRHEQKKCL